MIELLQSGEEIALTGYGLAEMRRIGDAIEREQALPYPTRIALFDNSQAFFFPLDQQGAVLKQVQAWLVGKEHSVKVGTTPTRNQTRPLKAAPGPAAGAARPPRPPTVVTR